MIVCETAWSQMLRATQRPFITRAKREERRVLNRSAQPRVKSSPQVEAADAPTSAPPRATRPTKLSWSARDVWAALTASPAPTDARVARLRIELLPVVAPAMVCALALLFAQGAPIHWLIACGELLAAACALAGISILFTARQAPAEQASRRAAAALGGVWLAVAALCALPMLLSGLPATLLALALAGVALLLYATDAVRARIAPLDELLTPLGLGPGLFALTIVAQGQRFTRADWLVAGALGGTAFAVIVGMRMRASAANDQQTHAGRSLATMLGARVVAALVAIALAISYALVVAIAVPRGTWPGALLALTSAPLALIGFSGLAVSFYLPARHSAARQLMRAYLWFGLALAAGLALTVVAQQVIHAISQAIGG